MDHDPHAMPAVDPMPNLVYGLRGAGAVGYQASSPGMLTDSTYTMPPRQSHKNFGHDAPDFDTPLAPPGLAAEDPRGADA